MSEAPAKAPAASGWGAALFHRKPHGRRGRKRKTASRGAVILLRPIPAPSRPKMPRQRRPGPDKIFFPKNPGTPRRRGKNGGQIL